MGIPNRIELVYGKSGSGKTTWWARLAEWFWINYKLRTRLYIGDGGLETVLNTGLIDEGIVEYMDYSIRDHPLNVTQKICKGYWSKDPFDPQSPLYPQSFTDLAPFGMFVYEGLSVMSDYIMSNREGGLAWRAGRGEKIGTEAAIALKDEEATFGGPGWGHYGFTQARMLNLIESTKMLPGWKQWTAHVCRWEDKKTNEVGFGPDIAGQALTPSIGASFGNTIHLHPAHKNVKVKDPLTNKDVEVRKVEYRAYTREHYDPDGQTFVKYYANNRMPPEYSGDLPEYLDPNPVAFYDILAKAAKKAKDARAGVVEH